MTKPRLTLEEHKELGLTLATMRDELVKRSAQVDNAYPRTGPEAKAQKKIHSAYEAIDEARCILEEALFKDYPDAETTVYYPQQETREAARSRS